MISNLLHHDSHGREAASSCSRPPPSSTGLISEVMARAHKGRRRPTAVQRHCRRSGRLLGSTFSRSLPTPTATPRSHPTNSPLVLLSRTGRSAGVVINAEVVQPHQANDNGWNLQRRHAQRPSQDAPTMNQNPKCTLDSNPQLRQIKVVCIFDHRNACPRNWR